MSQTHFLLLFSVCEPDQPVQPSRPVMFEIYRDPVTDSQGKLVPQPKLPVYGESHLMHYPSQEATMPTALHRPAYCQPKKIKKKKAKKIEIPEWFLKPQCNPYKHVYH